MLAITNIEAAIAPIPGGLAPAVFIGHGSPMNVLQQSQYTDALRNAGMLMPRPAAILVVSAHWITESTTAILNTENPRTIHDFNGFPPELYQIDYPASGSTKFAEAAHDLLGDFSSLRSDWGLDHGTWSVLRFMYPYADIPVFQVSIDIYKHPRYHLEVGRILGRLRAANVMIIGSGNIVHPDRSDPRAPFLADTASEKWAQEFDSRIWKAVQTRNYDELCDFNLIPNAKLAVPYMDHYAPLLYVMGATIDWGKKNRPRQIYSGFQRGTISMRSFAFTN